MEHVDQRRAAVNRIDTLRHRFLERIPEVLDDGVLYLSVEFCVAVHKCCCGCGSEVVTPLSPTDWQATFDGESVTLDPSIGNWSFQCRSHYWITNCRVVWAAAWSQEQINAGRRVDNARKERYFSATADTSIPDIDPLDADPEDRISAVTVARRWLSRLGDRFLGH
jgi:hypothetical protein